MSTNEFELMALDYTPVALLLPDEIREVSARSNVRLSIFCA